jgi:mannose-6-phosphate isomerase-like protein (cupin superfamily)
VSTNARYGVGEAFQVMQDVVTFHATIEDTDDQFLAFQVEVGPGGGPPPLHTHEAAEFFWTLKGDLSYFRQDEEGEIVEITGGAGTHAFIPSNVPHTYRNLSDEPAAYLGILSPGRSMQNFLFEVARDVGTQPLTPEYALGIGASFGVVTLDIVPGEVSPG